MQVILFNGPPGCGKDTAAQYIWRNRYALMKNSVMFERMSMPNKRAFAGMTNTIHNLDMFGNNSKWEPLKDQPSSLLEGKSYRQWQIDFSESFMKPLYGNDVFARLFLQRIIHRANDDYTIVVPDCGFQIESDYLLDHSIKTYLFHIHRDGKDFSKDSRGYIEPRDTLKGFARLDNNGTIEEFCDGLKFYLETWGLCLDEEVPALRPSLR